MVDELLYIGFNKYKRSYIMIVFDEKWAYTHFHSKWKGL